MKGLTSVLLGTALAVALGGAAAAQDCSLPPLAQKDTYVVGFSQTESNNPWRIAETKSMQDEAAARGWQLIYTDAAGSAAKQVADVDSLIAQGVDFLVVAPREEKPLIPAVKRAQAAGIPMILVDRNVDQTLAKSGCDYITFIGSDFIDQGRRVAEKLIELTGGQAKIIQLEGTTGSSPANDRGRGFADAIAGQAGMEIVASQSGDFARDLGRQVAESLLQAHPEATVVYAHNDEMAIGAIAAIEAAGKVPGQDILVVSIDGTKDAMQAIIDGKMAFTVESAPFMGPDAFETAVRYAAGETIEPWVKVEDRFFDQTNAAEHLPDAY